MCTFKRQFTLTFNQFLTSKFGGFFMNLEDVFSVRELVTQFSIKETIK